VGVSGERCASPTHRVDATADSQQIPRKVASRKIRLDFGLAVNVCHGAQRTVPPAPTARSVHRPQSCLCRRISF
jgi:hypothetical protein